jgi:hypothetical protein
MTVSEYSSFRENGAHRESWPHQEYAAEKITGAAWATNYLGHDPRFTLEAFQKDLTVDLIRTPRSAFESGLHEALAAVVQRNRTKKFDFLPVVAELPPHGSSTRDRIVGLIELVPFIKGADARGLVHENMRPLSDENLIGADASIVNFVRDADRQPCRLIVSGPEISGLVSLSDLQRLPVRAALFAMVTHLEMIMADSIRREFQGSEDWIHRLSPDRQGKVRNKVIEAKAEDVFVETLLLTEFGDKVTIIKRRPNFCWGRKAFKSEMGRVQLLRNDLAHAKNYAVTREAANRVCETARFMEAWIGRLGI